MPVHNLSLPIRGERLSIRVLEERDLEDLYALETDPKVKCYVGGPELRLKDEWITPMRARLGEETCPFAIVLNQDASFVGRALLAKSGLTTTSRPLWEIEWEIQVLIARQNWGKGFGREAACELIKVAFSSPEVTSVVAVVDPNNIASRELMDNLGFQHDGQKSSPGNWDDNHMVFRLDKRI